MSLVNTLIDRTIIRTYLFAYIAPGTPDGTPNRAAIEAVMPALSEQVAVLDRAVARGHLVGDPFTFADINLMPLLHRLKIPPEGAAALAAAKNLSAYYARHAERPSFVRTEPPQVRAAAAAGCHVAYPARMPLRLVRRGPSI